MARPCKIYFNGVLQTNGGVRDNVPVTIGDIGDGGTTANFIGDGSWNDPRPTEQQDDFRIYGYELSAADVLELFQGDVNRAPVGVADAYDDDGGRGARRRSPRRPGQRHRRRGRRPSPPPGSPSRPTES